jgi:hypothetical protein
MDIVCTDSQKHVSNNKISLIFFYFYISETYWCLPIEHSECICLPDNLTNIKVALRNAKYHNKIVPDKKNIVQLLGEDYGFIDINVYRFLDSGDLPNDIESTNSHRFVEYNFKNLYNLNKCVPIYKHARMFVEAVSKIKNISVQDANERGFTFTNNIMTDLFAKLESNGLCVNDDFTEAFGEEQNRHIKNNIVFSQYNLLTSTRQTIK